MQTAIRILLILVFSLCTCMAGSTTNNTDELHLRTTIQSVVFLGDFSGVVIPVHADPRFALTVHIESADPAISNFHTGDVVTFAIHSPSLLLGCKAEKGKTYNFVLHKTVENGKVRFFGLQIQRTTSGDHGE